MTIANDMGKNNSDVGKLRNHGFSLVELLMVTLIIIVLAAIGIPSLMSMVRGLRTAGDARDLNGTIMQAKMRASSYFARTRLYADLSANTFRIEIQPSGSASWTSDCAGTGSCNQFLSRGVSFGYGSLTSPPNNTQSTLAQALPCKDNATDTTDIANTACIIFNSRGIPITPGTGPTPPPTGEDAIYVTDGKSVTGVTVALTGLSRVWRTEATGANWKQQ
jgi:prepilin-type N-terminal cleavage/methylation domain-containing protein